LEKENHKNISKRVIMVMDNKDNVATVIKEKLEKMEFFEYNKKKITAKSEILFGHKVALCELLKGDYVYKYGEVIGKANRKINPGEHVHLHNVTDVVDELRHQMLKSLNIMEGE